MHRNMVCYDAVYRKRTESEYAAEQRGKQEKHLFRRARELGYEMRKLEEPAEPLPA